MAFYGFPSNLIDRRDIILSPKKISLFVNFSNTSEDLSYYYKFLKVENFSLHSTCLLKYCFHRSIGAMVYYNQKVSYFKNLSYCVISKNIER